MNTKFFMSFGVALLGVLTLIQGASLWLEYQSRPVPLVHDEELLNKARCYANADGVSCSFTNLTDNRVVGCFRGLVAKKQGSEGLVVESQTICTGAVEPLKTIEVSGRWEKGEPIDLCKKTDSLVGERLDWSQCSFTTRAMPVLPSAP